jgi:hypothetical protein
MAKGDHLTPYQRGVVRRYYEHRGDAAHQKLSEIVSELYACDDQKRANRLWRSVENALKHTDTGKGRVKRIVEGRDLEELARLVGELF